MDHSDKAIRRFRRHVAMLLVLKYTLPVATAWAFAWGIAVLGLRAAAGMERLPLLWGLAGLAAILALGVLHTRRHWPSATAVRALLDEQSGCGGILMAGAEQELGGWRQKLPTLARPRVRWDGQRSVSLFVIAAGFVLLSFLAPQGLADLANGTPLEVDRDVSRLLEQIALLKSEGILDPERSGMLQEKLAKLLEDSTGKDPTRTLEALDHLRQLTGESAREGVEARARGRERLAEAAALAEIMQRAADLIGPGLKKEGLADLAGLLEKHGPELPSLARHLDPSLLKAMQAKMLDPEQMRGLIESLRDTKAELMRQAEKMHKAGLIDAELLAKCQRAGECDIEGLRAFLKKNGGKASLAELKSRMKEGGRGGMSRGPGEAPMTWQQGDTEKQSSFKEELLPPGALASLKSHSTSRPGNPRGRIVVHDKPGGPASSGALQGAAAGDGSANNTVILPRHRGTVERYFERQTASEK
jgi:hypothetical protein